MESSSHLVSGRDSPLTVHPNGSKAPKSHSLDLKKVFVNGFQQQISHSATLSLKDGDGPFSSLPARAPGAISAVTYRNHMQIHIDGKTLANWDLSQLIQHKLIGGDGFYSFADMKMLKLALPLPTIGLDHENQPKHELGTIELYIKTQQDFHTAVNYLSKDVELRHTDMVRIRLNTHQSRPSSLPRQASIEQNQSLLAMKGHFPLSHHLSQRLAEFPPHTAGVQPPYRPMSANSALDRIQRRSSSYLSSAFSPSESQNQPMHMPNQWPVEVGSGYPMQPDFDPPGFQPHRHSSQNIYRTSSRSVDHGNYEPMVFPPGRQSPPMRCNSSAATFYHGQSHPSTSLEAAITLRDTHAGHHSRPGTPSEIKVPVKIQFLDSSSAPRKHLYSRPRSGWEMTLNLLPSTKAIELCIDAARHIHQNLGVSVDGRMLEARDKDGNIFDEDNDMSRVILMGETIFLTERVPANVRRPYQDSFLDPLLPYLKSNTDISHDTRPIVPREDQVPPPRRLPFKSAKAGAVTSTAQRLTLARTPLAERPDLASHDSRTAIQETSPQPEMNVNTSRLTGTKRSALGQGASGRRRRPPRPESGNQLASIDKDDLGRIQGVATSAISPNVTTRSAASQINKTQVTGVYQQVDVVPTAIKPRNVDEGAHVGALAESACTRCRRNKWECDRSMPNCGRCEQDAWACVFPKKLSKSANLDVRTQDRNNVSLNVSLTDGDQTPASAPTMHDIATQTSTRMENMAVQTEEAKDNSDDVEMKDSATSTLATHIDAAVETSQCNDVWLPCSKSLDLVSWAKDQYDKQLEEAADVLRTTDSSRKDYRDKVYLAAQCGLEFELELRERCEKALENSS